ncbi:hypothetical protein B4100_2549 [Heyndrickxia coagulans]|nr:hypothetical protein B4100_2549 [Heyndrickxia coagulans]
MLFLSFSMEKRKQNGHLPCFQLNTPSILTCMKKNPAVFMENAGFIICVY